MGWGGVYDVVVKWSTDDDAGEQDDWLELGGAVYSRPREV